VRVNYIIVFASDMARAISFYRDALGLPLKFESPIWAEFATDGATLALHASSAGSAESDAAEHSRAGHCRPGFSVSDLDAFHARMLERGVTCIEEPREVFGARLAQYRDPDGLAISVGDAH
jgi:lactoylglutathione lyase